MRIRPALKGRNKILDHKPVLPLQGVAILNTRSNSQGDALGWRVAAPSGRDSRNATSKIPTGVSSRSAPVGRDPAVAAWDAGVAHSVPRLSTIFDSRLASRSRAGLRS